jgi:hypothetical protein
MSVAVQAVLEPLEKRLHLSYASRGKISVIVDETKAAALSAELAQFKQDLIGDGWTVSMHTNAPWMDDDLNVWDNDPPSQAHAVPSTTTQYRADLQTVKDMIAADNLDQTLKAIVIVGHVTVPYSGTTSYDSHGGRAMPTDQYYADLDATPQNWGDTTADVSSWDPPVFGTSDYEFTPNTPGDGRFDANTPVNGVDLVFGRIDMANLGTTFLSTETELLRRYFERDHNYRTALFRPENKALYQNDANLSILYPNFESVLGQGNVDEDYWYPHFTDPSPTHYLFAARSGSGTPSSFNDGPQQLSSHNFGDAELEPLRYPPNGGYETPLHAVFTIVSGSFMADWNNRRLYGDYVDVPMHRALVGANYPGLVEAENGEALVSMSMQGGGAAGLIDEDVMLGETVGEGYRQAVNASPLVFQEFLGDPTLRLAYVRPASDVTLSINLSTGDATVQWNASDDDIPSNGFLGYEIYRSGSLDGTFSLVHTISGQGQSTTWTDTDPEGEQVYMVRAIKQTSTTAGNYNNASTGVFASEVTLVGRSVGDDVYLKRFTGTSEDSIRVWANVSRAGEPNYKLDAGTTTSIEFDGNAGDDLFTLDHAAGSPVPAEGGATFNGGADKDYLIVWGISGADTATFTSDSITMNGRIIHEIDTAEVLYFDGKLGGDTLSVADGVIVKFTDFQELASLNLNNSGTIDLGEGDLLVRAGAGWSYDEVAGSIAYARHGNAWDRPGITSTAARNQQYDATMLGALKGSEYVVFHDDEFNGLAVTNNDMLVKYTWYGDSDFDGRVNFADYVQIDTGFNNHLTGWMNGDFDLSGPINFGDYVLIDLGFNRQSGALRPGDDGGDGGGGTWAEVAQMEHFSADYMYYLIDALHEHGIYLTEADFYPG